MSDHIARLDASLARSGEDVVLRRMVGVTDPVTIDVACRAHVRGYTAQELTATIIQGDSHVILSPTEINRAQWPGGLPLRSPPREGDPRVPKRNDQVLIAGRARNVEAATPIYAAGELVRIDLQVRGQR